MGVNAPNTRKSLAVQKAAYAAQVDQPSPFGNVSGSGTLYSMGGPGPPPEPVQTTTGAAPAAFSRRSPGTLQQRISTDTGGRGGVSSIISTDTGRGSVNVPRLGGVVDFKAAAAAKAAADAEAARNVRYPAVPLSGAGRGNTRASISGSVRRRGRASTLLDDSLGGG